MEETKKTIQTIDAYIEQCPSEVQESLSALRQFIQECAPEAKEKISWGMPTYDYYGNLIHFAAAKKHIGIYPGENGVAAFKDKLTEYKTSKGAIQIPFHKPMPYDLLKEIIAYRIKENIQIKESREVNKKSSKSSI
ncbi:MAG: iron chaperone [Anaerocolumna sp.]